MSQTREEVWKPNLNSEFGFADPAGPREHPSCAIIMMQAFLCNYCDAGRRRGLGANFEQSIEPC